MKTNFQMIRELDATYTPERMGIVSMKEIYMINKTLCLDEMDELALRNLRDFTVMFYTDRMEDDPKDWDKMSAITTVIDQKIWNKNRAAV